jgi:hypothetical protein
MTESAWEKFQKKYEVKPWDLLDPKTKRVSEEVADARMNICKGCEFLIKFTKQCKKCGCFMNFKTLAAESECPIGKWKKEIVND